jgi:uncharacterized membrane protein
VATFTVWRFDSATGAGEALSTLRRLRQEDLIRLHDAAIVSWPVDAKKPRTEQLKTLVGDGALGGAFWGLLFGLLFFVPLLGLAIGAAAGAIGGALADIGIDDDFIDEVRGQVTPGTSALFLLTSDAVEERVFAELAFVRGHVALIHADLSSEQEARLRDAFADEAPAGGSSA